MLRFLYAGILHECDYILRITADCPFFDIGINITLIAHCTYYKTQFEYDYYTYYEQGKDIPCVAYVPKGHFKELFSLDALFRAYKDTTYNVEWREHVAPKIWKNPSIYKIKRIEITSEEIESLPVSDINTPADLVTIRRLYDMGMIR